MYKYDIEHLLVISGVKLFDSLKAELLNSINRCCSNVRFYEYWTMSKDKEKPYKKMIVIDFANIFRETESLGITIKRSF